MESKKTQSSRTFLPGPKDKTILVVEDNPLNRKLLVHFLEPTGANIIAAQDGAEAISMLHEHSPDLVFMDMQMPKMDGYEATRRAKADSEIASIPIIALTASALTADRDRCLEAGCDGYLAKPISREQIFRIIADFLSPNVQPSQAQSSTSGDNQWISRIAKAIETEYAAQLKNLLAKRDPSALRRFGHTMKGLGRQFQLTALAEWGEAFEKSAETLSPDALREKATQFEAIAKEIKAVQSSKEEGMKEFSEGRESLDKVK